MKERKYKVHPFTKKPNSIHYMKNKFTMKSIIILFLLVTTIGAFPQNEKTVTLITSGTGTTMEQATQNALRSAIEQAFGVFISSNTKILNDNIIKDEIISISNGNIQKYDVISKVQINDRLYATTLKAIVSISKLTSFCESKGVSVEFKGSLFAFNIMQQKINETNELKAITSILQVTSNLLKKSFWGSIKMSEPYLLEGNIYQLPIEVEIRANKNVNVAVEYFYQNIRGLALTKGDIDNYNKLNKQIYELILVASDKFISGNFTYFKVYGRESWVGVGKINEMKSENILTDYLQTDKRLRDWIDYFCKPDNKLSKIYSCESIILRNEKSLSLIDKFCKKTINEILGYSIKTNTQLSLSIAPIFTAGTIPFSDYYISVNGRSVTFPKALVLQKELSKENQSLYILNELVVKYISKQKRKSSKPLVLSLHKYKEDGMVLNVFGTSDLQLKMMNEISKINLEYK